MQLISLREVISQMNSHTGGEAATFSITFVKLNVSKRTGGEIVTISGAQLNSARTKSIQGAGASNAKASNNHTFDRHTINIYINGEIKKVHLQLITFFNGKKVVI